MTTQRQAVLYSGVSRQYSFDVSEELAVLARLHCVREDFGLGHPAGVGAAERFKPGYRCAEFVLIEST